MLIDRNNVIPGAVVDSFHVAATVFHCDSEVKRATVELTRAQILALNTTPIVLVPQVASHTLVVLGVYYSKPAGTAYTGGGNVTINYTDTSSTQIASISANAMRSANAASGWATRAAHSGTPPATFPDDGIDCSVGTTFANGGEPLTLTVVYLEAP